MSAKFHLGATFFFALTLIRVKCDCPILSSFIARISHMIEGFSFIASEGGHTWNSPT